MTPDGPTLAVCGGASEEILEPLRAAVRPSAPGRLVRAGCPARHPHDPHHAGNRVRRPALRAAAQPRTHTHTPDAPALTFDPLTDTRHTEALAARLPQGLPQGHRPPRHLSTVRPSRHRTQPRPP